MIPVNSVAEQNSHALGRPGHQSSSIGDPGTTFFVNDPNFCKERNVRKGGMWKLPQVWKSIKVAFGNIFLMIFTPA